MATIASNPKSEEDIVSLATDIDGTDMEKGMVQSYQSFHA